MTVLPSATDAHSMWPAHVQSDHHATGFSRLQGSARVWVSGGTPDTTIAQGQVELEEGW